MFSEKKHPRPLSTDEVLIEEQKAIASARVESGLYSADDQANWSLGGDGPKAARTAADNMVLSALCLSGGGIRSATFSLGVIQRLAKQRPAQAGKIPPTMLEQFDYLSTVSGGGFIGSWLSAWIHHENPGGFKKVIRYLQPRCGNTEASQINHLRQYTSYLSPHFGLFSSDTWAMFAIYLRNTVLNFFVIGPVFLAVLLLPRFALRCALWWSKRTIPMWVVVLTIAVGIVAQGVAKWQSDAFRARARLDARSINQNNVLLNWGAAQVVAVLAFHWICAWLSQQDLARGWRFSVCACAIAAMVLTAASWIASVRYSNVSKPGEFVQRSGTSALAGLIGSLLLMLVAYWKALDPATNPIAYTVAGPPVFLLAILLAATVYQGVFSSGLSDTDREYDGRASGWLLSVACAWLVAAWLVLVGPSLLIWGTSHAKVLVSAGATASGIITLLLSYSGKTQATAQRPENSRASQLTTWALNIVAPVFITLLLILGALSTDVLLSLTPHTRVPEHKILPREIAPISGQPHSRISRFQTYKAFDARNGFKCTATDEPGMRIENAVALAPISAAAPPLVGFDLWWSTLFADRTDVHSKSLQDATMLRLSGWFLIFVATALFAGSVVNINRFSLNGSNRNRLIRAYLGASRCDRKNGSDYMPFTGFAENDNIKLSELTSRRPLHVINAALNLVGGGNLAWQQRKAASFTFTQLHCGSALPGVGYRCSKDYATQPEGPVHLGGAMAISGAAANPNMGYLSSSPLALLMTMFNIRLGAWMGNPGKQKFDRATPRLANRLLIEEALGWTDEQHDYVNLSDGGHFENLGIYEMVRRRCRFILAIDADQDLDMQFDNLGNAVRKVYIDLGVEIKFKDPPAIYPRDPKPTEPLEYAAVATIDYGPGTDPGILIYIKPAFYGREPMDVYQYAQENRKFPHDPTLNQFFTESQFESYRRLGYYIMDSLLAGARDEADLTTLAMHLTQRLQRPSAGVPRSMSI